MKAKMVGKINDKYGKYVDFVYEYRGEQYFIRNYFNGNALGESMYQQHKEEQERIDALIESRKHPVDHEEWKYEGSADEAFDKLFEIMGW